MIAWLAALATAAPPPTDDVLDDRGGFSWCTDADRGGPEVMRLCPLVEGLPPDRCPGLQKTCAAGTPPPPEPVGCEPPRAESDRADRVAGAPDAPPERDEEWDLSKWDLEDLRQTAAAIARWVTAFLVATIVLLLLRAAWRTFAAPRGRPAPAPTAPDAPVVEAAEELPPEPVPNVLAAARAALDAGRFDEVIVLARGAALKHLQERGRLALHRARTDREYVRELRRGGGDGEALATITRSRERWLFGRAPLDADTARAVLSAAERLVAAALLLLIARTAAAADPRYAPNGDAALPLVLQAWGHQVTWRLRSLDDLDADTDVLLLDLGAVGPTAEQLWHVREWVGEGGVLWVAGRPVAGFDELGDLTVEGCVPEVDPAFEHLATPRLAGVGTTWVTPQQGVVWCGSGALVQVVHLGEGAVVAFADDAWLRNGAFVDPGTERFVGDLLHVGRIVDAWPTEDPPRIELATSAAADAPSEGANNPFRSVANARLLPFVLQLLLAGATLAVWRGWPFSPLREPASTGRSGFSEHVRALGVRLGRGRASGVAARSLARYWHGRLGTAGLVLAAERHGRSRADAHAFAREVEDRATGDGRPGGPADHAFMEDLWTITRGRTP